MSQTVYEFILYCADQERSTAFYSEILERLPVLKVPGMTEFQLTDGVKLGLMPEAGIAKILQERTPLPASGNGIPRCELYLYVDNVREAFDRAVSAGAKRVSDPSRREWGDTVGYIADFDGHIIAFARAENTGVT